jgi:hypothetical protein
MVLFDEAVELELDGEGNPKPGDETWLGDELPDELQPAGRWASALALESRPRPPPGAWDVDVSASESAR